MGPDQVVVVQHPDDAEFLVNVYVYPGGTLILPPSFVCHGISMHIWCVYRRCVKENLDTLGQVVPALLELGDTLINCELFWQGYTWST